MTDAAEIARLKAEAAQAAAEAAAAKAAAAQAALDAALAENVVDGSASPAKESVQSAPAEPSGGRTGPDGPPAAPPSGAAGLPPSSTEPTAPASSEPGPTADAEGPADIQDSAYTAQVRSGYGFSSPTLPVGTYLDTLADGDPAPVPGLNVGIPLGLLNRHALVAGATGTGKTRTLQLLAEGLSNEGVPVFLADVKGDLTGLAEPGATGEKLAARLASTGQTWEGRSFPIELFSLGGGPQSGAGAVNGTPIRTTVTEFGRSCSHESWA